MDQQFDGNGPTRGGRVPGRGGVAGEHCREGSAPSAAAPGTRPQAGAQVAAPSGRSQMSVIEGGLSRASRQAPDPAPRTATPRTATPRTSGPVAGARPATPRTGARPAAGADARTPRGPRDGSGARPGADARRRGRGTEPARTPSRGALVFLAVVALVVLVLYRPAQSLYRAQRDQQVLQERLEQTAQDSAAYQDRIDALHSDPNVQEEVAREQGYVGPGEVGVDVEGLPAEQQEAPQPKERPWYVVLGDFVFQYREGE